MIAVRLKKAFDSYTYKSQVLKDYQTLLEEIIHFMIKTCHNLAYFISQLAKFSSN